MAGSGFNIPKNFSPQVNKKIEALILKASFADVDNFNEKEKKYRLATLKKISKIKDPKTKSFWIWHLYKTGTRKNIINLKKKIEPLLNKKSKEAVSKAFSGILHKTWGEIAKEFVPKPVVAKEIKKKKK